MTRRGIAIELAKALDFATHPGFASGELILYRTNELPIVVPFGAAGLSKHLEFMGRIAEELQSDCEGFPMFFGGCLSHLPDESFDWTLATMLCALEVKRQ